MSSDGTKCIAASNSNGIYYSGNYGVTWTKSSSTSGLFYGVEMSSDGTKCLAASGSNNGIYYSDNYGVTWT